MLLLITIKLMVTNLLANIEKSYLINFGDLKTIAGICPSPDGGTLHRSAMVIVAHPRPKVMMVDQVEGCRAW